MGSYAMLTFVYDITSKFFFIFVFSIQLTLNNCSVYKFADDWIRTADLWCRRRPLYQLSHNHCPSAPSLMYVIVWYTIYMLHSAKYLMVLDLDGIRTVILDLWSSRLWAANHCLRKAAPFTLARFSQYATSFRNYEATAYCVIRTSVNAAV